MRNRFIIRAMVVGALVWGTVICYIWLAPSGFQPFTEAELANARVATAVRNGETNFPTPAPILAMNRLHPVRLAIGGLGMVDDEKNGQLGDLVTAELTGARGFELVERESLTKVLQEQNLTLSGLVRAKDAVRIGKLLKVEWFLLGTETRIAGSNCLVARVVDARTGMIRNAGVFTVGTSVQRLGADLAAFLRQERADAADSKMEVYLAIGAFEDLSVNNRQADFPSQLRGYLTAAYRGTNVTLLERESVDVLLREVHLDLAGLMDEADQELPITMQSAMWLVSGQYQSYETTNLQVEVNLEVRRVFGRSWHVLLRGGAGDSIGRQVKAAVDNVMAKNGSAIVLTRFSEARVEMDLGKEMSAFTRFGDVHASDFDLVYVNENLENDPQLAAKQRRNLEEATSAFEAALLLEPTNRLAKMYLAACSRHPLSYHPDDALNYYREIIDDPVQDKWTGLAQRALDATLRWSSPEERLRWFGVAAAQTTNPMAADFYGKLAEAAQKMRTMQSGDTAVAEGLIEQRLFDFLKSCDNYLHGRLGNFGADLGIGDYVKALRLTNAAAAKKLADLFPKMTNQEPALTPYLQAAVLTYELDTNTPLAAEFERTLEDIADHPQHVLKPSQFWYATRWSVYNWCLEKTNYPLGIKLIEAEQRAIGVGQETFRDAGLEFDDQEKIKLAFLYMAAKRWHDALDLAESFNDRPIKPTVAGPWGCAFQPVLTDKLAARCRQELGITLARNARTFEIGKPLMCLCSPSAFTAADDCLWVGIGGQLLNLDFNLKTNFMVHLPIDESVPITALCSTPTEIWVGTRGAGLVEFNKSNRQLRYFTEADGLMMNDLTSLAADRDSLWIGYGGSMGGGLGKLNLTSLRTVSFMPSLEGSATAPSGGPPHNAVGGIVTDPAGDLWMSTAGTVREFHVSRGTWETVSAETCEWITCFGKNSQYFIAGGGTSLIEIGVQDRFDKKAQMNNLHQTNLVVSPSELRCLEQELRTNGNHRYVSSTSTGRLRPRGALAIQDLRNRGWRSVDDSDVLPNPLSTMTLDGNQAWVGGEDVIALVDLTECKVKKYSHVKAASVDHIQVAGGYLWAQLDSHLYRVPLSSLR